MNTSNVTPFHKPKPVKQTVCSFCKSPKSKVKHMFSTETHAICDVCLEHATKRLEESNV